MKKIIEFFYVFSKLTTSFLMLLVIFVLMFLLFSSYKNIDKSIEAENYNIDKKLLILSEAISKNNEDLKKLSKSIISDEDNLRELMSSISKILVEPNNSSDIEIKKIKTIVEKLQIKINQILSDTKKQNIKKQSVKNNNASVQLGSLVEVIIIKFKNGLKIKNEVTYLDKLLPDNKKYIIDKLLLLELRKFYGMEGLDREFDISINRYTKDNFKLRNESAVINFILKFVNIRPNNLSEYQNEELNILMSAKDFIEKEDIKESLNRILLINKSEIHFDKWIGQANIYLEFMKTIKEVY